MARMITGLTVEGVHGNLMRAREQVQSACSRAGREQGSVKLLAAVKYVSAAEIGVLSEAGVRLAGENRAQDLVEKAALAPELEWHFIGHLQSRKVKQIAPLVSLIHSVSSESVVDQLAAHTESGAPILIEVNVSGEDGKSGVSPAALPDFLARCREIARADVRGLMTMPPLASRPEDSRRWFAMLAELSAEHGLTELSMGTSQDYPVAVEEGATIVRLGASLYA